MDGYSDRRNFSASVAERELAALVTAAKEHRRAKREMEDMALHAACTATASASHSAATTASAIVAQACLANSPFAPHGGAATTAAAIVAKNSLANTATAFASHSAATAAAIVAQGCFAKSPFAPHGGAATTAATIASQGRLAGTPSAFASPWDLAAAASATATASFVGNAMSAGLAAGLVAGFSAWAESSTSEALRSARAAAQLTHELRHLYQLFKDSPATAKPAPATRCAEPATMVAELEILASGKGLVEVYDILAGGLAVGMPQPSANFADARHIFQGAIEAPRRILSNRAVERVWADITQALRETHFDGYDGFVASFRQALIQAVAKRSTWSDPHQPPRPEIPSTNIWVRSFSVRTGLSPPLRRTTIRRSLRLLFTQELWEGSMGRFNDKRLEEIYYYGETDGVTPADCAVIQRKLHILTAARGWITLPLVGKPVPAGLDRTGIEMTGKWRVTFDWYEGAGAAGLELEP